MSDGLARMHPATRDFLRPGLTTSLANYLTARRRRFAHARALDEALGGHGLMLSPVSAVAGIPADGRLDDAGTLGGWPDALRRRSAVPVPGCSPTGWTSSVVPGRYVDHVVQWE